MGIRSFIGHARPLLVGIATGRARLDHLWTKSAQYAFGETDEDGRRNIESFAAQHRSVINFMPVERRVYFVRDPTAVTTLLKISLTPSPHCAVK